MEYTRLCGPLKAAMERVHELQREIEENERIQREKENQVLNTSSLFFPTYFFHKVQQQFFKFLNFPKIKDFLTKEISCE